MHRRIGWIMVGGALVMNAMTAWATDVPVGLDLASAYIFRGTTYNDGLVLQPKLEASGFKLTERIDLPLTVGVWGNLDLGSYGGRLTKGQFSELDLYAKYALPAFGKLNWALGYTEYAYPQGGEADREFNLGLGLDVLLRPSLTLYYGVGGSMYMNFYAEAGVGHTFELPAGFSLALDAMGSLLSQDDGITGLNHYQLKAALGWKWLALSAAYIGRFNHSLLPDATDDSYGYDREWLGMLSAAYTF